MGNATESIEAGRGNTPPSTWPPEQALLGLLLDAYPRELDLAVIAGELGPELDRITVERAATNLIAAGLVTRRAGSLVPVRAVLDFEARRQSSGNSVSAEES